MRSIYVVIIIFSSIVFGADLGYTIMETNLTSWSDKSKLLQDIPRDDPSYVPAIDSDYFIMHTADSQIPSQSDKVSLGVISKMNIPSGYILCEFRGSIISDHSIDKLSMRDREKTFSFTGVGF